ncbi:hypothetical protein BD770DRAFT_413126 [Pilaira anomala]|nr:hypothetical protein BD770DRAFT_413126 [Pilaira anomala]
MEQTNELVKKYIPEEFTKIEDGFPNYINSAELVSSKFCLTFLCSNDDNETTVDVVFDETAQNILREFPNSRRWMQWWLQPSISSTILICRSLMKESLRQHDSRTSNAIESYHSALYRF